MNIAQTILLADDGWSMHDGGVGWWIVPMVVLMALFMGGMMWMMMRGMGGGSSSASNESRDIKESPVETLERRFAAGEISVEDYRARREVLVNGNAERNGDRDAEPLTAPSAEERRQ